MKKQNKKTMFKLNTFAEPTIVIPTDGTDGAGNPVGIRIIEQFIAETLYDEILIPGVTVSPITFSKNGRYVWREIVGGAAVDTELCADAEGTEGNVVIHTFDIDRKVTATLSGCNLTNFTEIFYDVAKKQLAQEQLKAALNNRFKLILNTNAVAIQTPVKLTKDNILFEILRCKEDYRRTNKKPATFMIADYSVETFIKSNILNIPNMAASELLGSADYWQGLTILYADLSAQNKKFFIGRPDYNRFGLVDPDDTSELPGFEESAEDGVIIRTSEKHNNIARTTGLHLPYGLNIKKPQYVMSYLTVA